MIPTNEQELIIKFTQEHGPRFEIKRCQTAFPDAIIAIDGIDRKIEFEYELKSFSAHRHDVRKCDAVICWTKGMVDEFPLPVFALDTPQWQEVQIFQALDQELELWHWKMLANQWHRVALLLKKRLEETRPNDSWNGVMTPEKQAVFEALEQSPSTGVRELARQLKISPGTVSRHRKTWLNLNGDV